MKNYIDSEQYWEDSVNCDYDYMKAMYEQEIKDRELSYEDQPLS